MAAFSSGERSGWKDDVAIVRQDENVLGVDAVDGVLQIFDGGVHGLAALYDYIYAQILEDARNACTLGHGNHAVFFGRVLTRLLRLFLAMLFHHVFNDEIAQFAQLQAVLQGLAGIVGVHMYLDQRQIAHDQHAIADAIEMAAEGGDIAGLGVHAQMLNQELCAVGIFGLFVVIVYKVLYRGGGVHGSKVDMLSAQRSGIACIDAQQAAAARIHHTGLLEGRQHIGGELENVFTAGKDYAHQRIIIIGGGLRLFYGFFSNDARDSQDGALLGAHDGLISHLRTCLQRLGKLDGGNLFNALQRAREAAEQLGQDDAAVAARAAQRALGQSCGSFAGVYIFLAADFARGAHNGKRHIGARVAVRHGEYVQRIYRFTVFFQLRGG